MLSITERIERFLVKINHCTRAMAKVDLVPAGTHPGKETWCRWEAKAETQWENGQILCLMGKWLYPSGQIGSIKAFWKYKTDFKEFNRTEALRPRELILCSDWRQSVQLDSRGQQARR